MTPVGATGYEPSLLPVVDERLAAVKGSGFADGGIPMIFAEVRATVEEEIRPMPEFEPGVPLMTMSKCWCLEPTVAASETAGETSLKYAQCQTRIPVSCAR
jgi:hypothetical protein